MNILNGIQNFLQFINDNWASIMVIIALLISIIKKTMNYLKKSNDEKIEIAKKQIQETILRLITEAEIDYKEWTKAGRIKRSQVIEEIFLMYPVLSKVANQEKLIEWIDTVIDNALETLREVIKQNEIKEVSGQ